VAMIVIVLENGPEDPIPAMALPSIKASEVVAAAHTSEPSSNVARNARKVCFIVTIRTRYSGSTKLRKNLQNFYGHTFREYCE